MIRGVQKPSKSTFICGNTDRNMHQNRFSYAIKVEKKWINVHAHCPDIPHEFSGIGTYSFTVRSSPAGANHYNSACAIPPGTHLSWVARSSTEEVCLTLLHMSSSGNWTLDTWILRRTAYPLGHAPINRLTVEILYRGDDKRYPGACYIRTRDHPDTIFEHVCTW